MDSLRLTRNLYADGFVHPELARLSRAGELRPIRRGVYSLDPAPPTEERTTHRELIEATWQVLTRDDAVISHMSAAVLHGLPLWATDLDTVHVTCNRDGGGKQRSCNFIHVSPIGESEVVEIDGMRVTSLPRTVVDLARKFSMYKAVPIGDAALRQGLPPDQLVEALARCRGWPGVIRARRTVNFLDSRSESVGESCSRVRMAEAGLPAPDLQVELFDDLGTFVGRPDFVWLARRTLGEFDGFSKYGAGLRRPGQTAEDVVLEEKAREDALRELGFEVVRWQWDALKDPTILRSKVMRAFNRARRR